MHSIKFSFPLSLTVAGVPPSPALLTLMALVGTASVSEGTYSSSTMSTFCLSDDPMQPLPFASWSACLRSHIRSCRPFLRFPHVTAVVSSILQYLFLDRNHGHLPPRSFLSILPSWRVPALRVPCSTLALIQFLLMTPLLHFATFARLIIFLPATVSFLRIHNFQGSEYSWKGSSSAEQQNNTITTQQEHTAKPHTKP
jgi:hypothetical protein